ncbi:MAG: succinate dehydrogenase cytochrome b subunit [FCB group bacterium]|nr:succinate dehydrogenase cytochrome b subunit [FCB group bacterium]
MNTSELDQITSIPTPVNVSVASVSKKVLMAVTGAILLSFISVHLLGNLQIFIGQGQLNNYAETLQSLKGLKWTVRIVTIIAVIIHIWTGVLLWFENKKARPISYYKHDTIQASLSSRTMIYTGLLIFFFVIYHLLQFTLIVTNPQYANLRDALGRHDVYSMVILGFSNYFISGAYIIAVLMLAFHISHAISSFFQTLGWNNDKVLPKLKLLANIVAILFFIGYASIPVSVLLHIVKLPVGGY